MILQINLQTLLQVNQQLFEQRPACDFCREIPTGQPTSGISAPTGQPTGQPSRHQPFSDSTDQPSTSGYPGQPKDQLSGHPTGQPSKHATDQPFNDTNRHYYRSTNRYSNSDQRVIICTEIPTGNPIDISAPTESPQVNHPGINHLVILQINHQ